METGFGKDEWILFRERKSKKNKKQKKKQKKWTDLFNNLYLLSILKVMN